MNCTSAVFTLMSGAAAWAFSAMYFYNKNTVSNLRKKLKSYNTALSQLQEERAKMIVKTEDMFSENASLNVHFAHLTEENKILRGAMERLESDNRQLISEYKKLEELLFEHG